MRLFPFDVGAHASQAEKVEAHSSNIAEAAK
jgi:hypothetical protein